MSIDVLEPVNADEVHGSMSSFDHKARLVRLPLEYNSVDKIWEEIPVDEMMDGGGVDGYFLDINWQGQFMVQPFPDCVANGYGEGPKSYCNIIGLIKDLDTWMDN